MRKLFLCSLLLLTLTASAFAQDSTPRPAQTPPSVSTDATPTPVPKTVPRAILSDPDALRFVETLLANQARESARADSAESLADGWKRQADEWRGLYVDETKRSALLKGATEDRKEQGQDLKTANFYLQEQHGEDKLEIRDLRTEVSNLRASRFRWALGGAVTGVVTCVGATAPSIFGR